MKLYHTSDVIIKDPSITRGRKNADFGQGFYLSSDLEFSRRWAVKDSLINEYELDENGLEIIRLSRNADWFEKIMKNRRLEDTLPADIVIGPIANDTLFDTLGIIGSGFLSSDEALSLLMIGPEYTQVVIKTQKALDQLVWQRAFDAGQDEELLETIRKEREQYQIDFSEAMKKM
ncbi:DUF3990 domain-containing protein [Butyrivibrio sp. WCE2006]|uniref:DUF3990 domain-containing protein n=1 Tax=Butyrivibrio sp. WCE2006 TaxID=1410611 RepID=UPI0005D17495|nr:DUF3990 domain-containing protein [Butyrivibrio sp. WCE2006]